MDIRKNSRCVLRLGCEVTLLYCLYNKQTNSFLIFNLLNSHICLSTYIIIYNKENVFLPSVSIFQFSIDIQLLKFADKTLADTK